MEVLQRGLPSFLIRGRYLYSDPLLHPPLRYFKSIFLKMAVEGVGPGMNRPTERLWS
jgi:hypothetical protein